ncbi:hypothetical protein GS429_16825 [Natronorubrum sp. JWXQ-INN-674]|uniref:Rpa-associated protein n=1 Tax=Natronorubrum halalkaliphilum TaxID=2691917 RepID=A0A6B0VRC7_9EURY|nr:hypothetical protein [Natronorubrum halalkaliphilum]MXV63693.1 hypothetical protein [Natronorubrum halalkaliphilum]
MSANGTDDGDEEIPGRELAYRLFAAEYDDASFSYAESDEERAPNYVISPTGARLNRLFAVGTLTEVTSVNEEMVRARVVDPTGAFVVYAGQYQPDALATLEQLEPPAFVAVTGKARTFQPGDSEQVYTSIRPESIATVDADTRDRWVVSAAEQTLERIGTYAGAAEIGSSGTELTDALREAGIEPGLAAGIPLAQDHYGTTPSYLAALRDCALEAVEVVAGDRDQVGGLSLQPGGSSPEYESAAFDSLADLGAADLEALEAVVDVDTDLAGEATDAQPDAAEAITAGAGGSETDAEADAAVDTDSGSLDTGSAAGTATGSDRDTISESELESEDTIPSDADADADGDVDEPTAAFDETTDIDASPATDESAVAADADADGDDSEDEELGDIADEDGGMYEMDDDEREQLEEEFGAEFTTGAEVEEPGEAGIDVPEPDEEPAGGEADSAADAVEAEAETEPESEADTPSTDETVAETATETETETESDDLGAPPESGLEAEAEAEADDEDESGSEAEATEDTADADPVESAESADAEAPDDTEDDDPAEDVDLGEYVVETMEELDDGDGADRTELVETVAADTGASESDVEDAIQDALMGGQCYEPNDETLKAI